MKTINCWANLRAHGIDILAGEACGMAYRYLCDVTEQGKKAIEKLFNVALTLPENVRKPLARSCCRP